MDHLHLVLVLIAALGSGLIAGLFFVFSVCVMKALARLPTEQGIAAMQSINSTILNPIFFAVFFGTPLACVLVIIETLVRRPESGSVSLILGSVIYLVGSFLVTLAFNVPRNNALDAADPTSPEGAALWTDYLVKWTAWNHVRAVASLAALAFLIIGI